MSDEPKAEPTFKTLVGELAHAAAACLGEVDNPVTGARTVDLEKALHLLQLLVVLQEKTQDNLSEEEERFLYAAMKSLKERFVAVRDGA